MTVVSLVTQQDGPVTLTAADDTWPAGTPAEMTLRADGPAAHVVQLRAYGPDGREIEALRQGVTLMEQETITLYPAWNDSAGQWRFVARDLTTGHTAETKVHVVRSVAAGRRAAPKAIPGGTGEIAVRPEWLDLSGDVNFGEVKVLLRNGTGSAQRLKVRLRTPEGCLLSGELERNIELAAGAEIVATWPVCLTRSEAVAMYYSVMPAGFLVDHFRQEVRKYAGRPVPVVEVAADGPVRWMVPEQRWHWGRIAPAADPETGKAITPAAGWPDAPMRRLSKRTGAEVPVPLGMMPFTERPAAVGNLASEPLRVRVMNTLDRETAGKISLAPPEGWRVQSAEVAFSAKPGQAADVLLRPVVDRLRALEPAVVKVPLAVESQGRSWRDVIAVEQCVQQSWLVRAKPAGEQSSDAAGGRKDASAWQKVTGDGRIMLGSTLQAPGSPAVAQAWVWSPAKRKVTLRLGLVGLWATAHLNGVEAYTTGPSRKKSETDLLDEPGPALEKGWNRLSLEFTRIGNRWLEPTVALIGADGKCVHDIVVCAEKDTQ